MRTQFLNRTTPNNLTQMKTIPNALRSVLSRPLYGLLALAITAFAAIFLIVATSIPGQSVQSWLFSTSTSTKFLVIFSSVMLGLIGSVQLYAWRNFKTVKKRTTTLSAGAIMSTLGATACCSPAFLPFVGLAGFGTAFLFLQQHQTAVVLISSALLLMALHYSCKIVDCEECRVKSGHAKK